MSIVAFPASVPSCSGSGTRKRRNNDSDSESSGIKISRTNFYFVLESESDIPTSEEEETESIISLQNKSTDFAKDTSDTSSKTSNYGSDFEVEFEVVSMSEQAEVPFDSSSSGTDLDTWKRRPLEETASEASERSAWADNSSAEGVEESAERYKIPARLRSCLKCKAPTCVHFCHKCYKVRKDFFPPRPKLYKRKKVSRSFLKKKSLKERSKAPTDEKVPPTDEKVESGIESGSSQEIFLTPEEKPDAPVEHEGLCNVCLKKQKNGAFVHCNWVHIYACYDCSTKIWFTTRRCPLCNGKVNKVLQVAMG